MADKSLIEWTDATWNVVTGCDKTSAGCKNCYALREWPRLAANPNTVYYGRAFTDVQFHPDRLAMPLRWRKGRKIFVNAMSDLFHIAIDRSAIAQVFAVMALADQHTFQVLTKRADRMQEVVNALYVSPDLVAEAVVKVLSNGADMATLTERDPAMAKKIQAQASLARQRMAAGPLPNVHLGVSVEDQDAADARIPRLQDTMAAVRWISAEPLLSALDLRPYLAPAASKAGRMPIVWVVVGGETGPKARPMAEAFVIDVVHQCHLTGTAVNMKQWGEWAPDSSELANEKPDAPTVEVQGGIMRRVGKARSGRLIKGVLYDAYPTKQGAHA